MLWPEALRNLTLNFLKSSGSLLTNSMFATTLQNMTTVKTEYQLPVY